MDLRMDLNPWRLIWDLKHQNKNDDFNPFYNTFLHGPVFDDDWDWKSACICIKYCKSNNNEKDADYQQHDIEVRVPRQTSQNSVCLTHR